MWSYLVYHGRRETPMEELLGVRNQIIFLLIYSSALKVSDLTGLRSSHIDHSLGKPRVMVTPLRRDPYSVPIHPVFCQVYDRYQQLLALGKARARLEFSNLLFNANPFSILRGGLSVRGLELIFADMGRRLDLQVTPKLLRQAAIFRWLGEKHSDGLLKEWLGVAPSYSLKLYRHHLNRHYYDDSFLHYVSREITH